MTRAEYTTRIEANLSKLNEKALDTMLTYTDFAADQEEYLAATTEERLAEIKQERKEAAARSKSEAEKKKLAEAHNVYFEMKRRKAALTGKDADMMKHIEKIMNIEKHYSYSLTAGGVELLSYINCYKPFDTICDTYNLGFYNGMRYQRNVNGKGAK